MKTTKRFCSRPLTVGEGLSARCWSYDHDICPSCADLQLLYTKKMIGAGLEQDGFKFYLLTLTAPSFGSTHTVPHSPSAASMRCACGEVHEHGSRLAGVALNLKNYRYRDQVAWNNYSSKLFRHTIRKFEGELDGFAWVAVREFQKRGTVHVHAVVRVDASLSPTAVVKRLKKASRTESRGSVWGRMVDVRLLVDEDGTSTVRYLASVVNYAAKGTGLNKSKLSEEQRRFYNRLDRASLRLGYTGKQIAGFGFGGHSMTSSSNWTSLTREALKQQAREYQAARSREDSPELGKAAVDLNEMELRSLARRLGSREDFEVPASYAADVRARVGLGTPLAPVVSTSVESRVSADAWGWNTLD